MVVNKLITHTKGPSDVDMRDKLVHRFCDVYTAPPLFVLPSIGISLCFVALFVIH